MEPIGKITLTVLIALLLGITSFAEEDEAVIDTETVAVEKEPGDEPDEDTAEADDSDLDEQIYEDDDDDFIPTEEIPTDEPIPFPTNI